MDLEKLINKKIKIEGGYTDEKIKASESTLGFKLPSDLVNIYKQTNKIQFGQNAYCVSLDKKTNWIDFNSFHDLNWLVQERENDLKNEVYIFQKDYMQIGTTFGQDLILIGIKTENVNSIFFYSEEDEIIKLGNSIFEFINENLILM